MLDALLQLEAPLFLWLNAHHSPFLDELMWIITSKWTWSPVVISLIFITFYKHSKHQAVWLLVVIVLTLTCADQVSDAIIKAYFQRLRPTYHPDFKNLVHIVNEYQGAPYGFVSSHAANAFAIAVLLHKILQSRFLSIVLFFWAIWLSYSRIYLGVHFISDVVGGAILGAIIGYAWYRIYLWGRLKTLDKIQAKQVFITQNAITYFAFFWMMYLLLIVVISLFL